MSNLALRKREKINCLLKTWPSGTVMTQSRLEAKGISRQLSHFYRKNGWIEKLGHGAFGKAGDKVDWIGGLYAVQQQLGYKVHLGGSSLLEILGATHFVSLGAKRGVWIYVDANEPLQKKSLPKWFTLAFKKSATITYYARGLFCKSVGIEPFTQTTFPIFVASKERALMEVLALVPDWVSYSHAYFLFQRQEMLRPTLIQTLLECCLSYKVKRLFLHLGKKCELPWLSYLTLTRIDLGKGKLRIGRGGNYDSEYKISVPKLDLIDDVNRNIEV